MLNLNLFSAYLTGLENIRRWSASALDETVVFNPTRYYVSALKYQKVYWLRSFIYEWEPLQPWQWSTGSSFVWSDLFSTTAGG
ncbi:MAG: hypothetical protein DRJ35_08240 [Thermoprotei archaeon]|nr:MAG: hypothetical protein DRJ35_08240 [Thermoprotei archaeon]